MSHYQGLFEFKCEDEECGHQFERLMKHDEREVVPPCPECKGDNTTKMISRTSFSLKGGGWAADGYGGQ